MNCELTQDRQNDIRIENIWLRTFFGQSLQWFASGNTKETNSHQHTRDCNLEIAKFDTIKVQYRQTISRNQTIQGQNLVHLNCSNKGTTALTNNIVD